MFRPSECPGQLKAEELNIRNKQYRAFGITRPGIDEARRVSSLTQFCVKEKSDKMIQVLYESKLSSSDICRRLERRAVKGNNILD